MGLFDDLLEEDELLQQPIQPQSQQRKGGLFDDLLEEDDLIQDTTLQPSAPAAQPTYQYDPSGFRRKKPVSPEAQKEIGTLEGIANAARNAFDSSRQALDIVGDVTPEEAQNIAKIEFDKQSRKLAPGYDEYQKAEGFDAVLAFAKNPIEVTSNIVAEGLAGSLPALGAGLAAGGVGAAIGAPTGIGAPIGFTAGQVAGTFAGSLATEYGSKILEEMQSEGVDLTKPDSIQGFFENEEAVAKARDKAISRGIPVAAFDAISAGIGGKLGRVIGKQFLTKTGEAAAELGVQAGLGGGGEVAGALVAGEPIEGKAVFGEIIGEAGPGAAEIITGRMADRAARVKAEEEKKIKAAAQLSDNLEQNSAPLTAAAVKSTTATTIEQDKLAAQLEEQLDADEIASQVSGQIAPTITPAVTPAVPTAQPPITDATQEIIQPEGVRQEPQDRVEVRPTTEAGVSDSILRAERGQEEGQVVPTAEAPSAPTIKSSFEDMGAGVVGNLYDMLFGKLQSGDTTELGQPSRVLAEAMPAYQAGIIKDAKDLRNWVQGDVKLREAFEKTKAAPTGVAAPEPTISEIPQTSELVGAEPTQPTIREVPEISPIVGAEPAAIVEQEPVAPAEPAVARPSIISEASRITNELKQRWEQTAPEDRSETFNWTSRAEVELENLIGNLAGNQNAAARQNLIEEITGTKPTRQNAAIKNVRQAIRGYLQANPLQETAAQTTEAAAQPAPEGVTQVAGVPPLVKELATAGRESAAQLRARISNVKMGPIEGNVETFTFDLDGQTYRGELKGRNRNLVLGTNPTADAAIATRVLLDKNATPTTPVTTPPVTEAVTPAPEAAPTPAGISVGNRIKLGKSPQTYTIEEVIPQSATERELGEQYYSVKNERTGETQVVEARDLRQVKGKGARKLFAGERAEIPQFMRDSLDAARAMAAAGKTTEEIRAVTGWFPGKYDGKMRWEIPDKNSKLTTEVFLRKAGEPSFEVLVNKQYNILKNQGSTIIGNLSEILDHKDLYDSYPDIKNIQVEIAPLKGKSVAAFIAEKPKTEKSFGNPNTIILNARNFPKDIKSVLLHEIQHAIQNKESFAKGGSTKEFGKKYTKLAGEIEARDIQARKDLTPEQLAATAPYSSENISPEDAIVIQESEDAASEVSPTPENILITPPEQQYTFNEVFDVAYDMFGGEIPEGFTIVNDSKDKDFEFKAAYIPESGEIIVNLAYLNKNDDIRDAITHELGHYIYGDPEFRAAFDQFIASLSPEARADLDAYVDTAYNKETGEIRLEEKMVRAFVDQFINEEQAPAWRSMLNAIKRFLNKLGFKFNISDRDAISVFTAALDRYKAGEAISREGGARMMAAEPRREQVAGMKIGRIITTPPGITQKTTGIIRSKFFDSTKVSPENTSQAWAYISQFMDKTDNNNNKFAGYVNTVTELEQEPDFRVDPNDSLGAALLSIELTNYAARLAQQGDTKMLAYMIRNGNKMPTGEFAGGASLAGKVLNSFKERLGSDISGVAAFETEMKSNVERLAAKLFGTNAPSAEQIKIAQDALTESETIELGDANQVAADIKEVETRTNKDILKKIDDLISGYDNPKKDQLLLIFANLIRSRDVDGITISYKPTKVSISDRIANLLVKNLANYRDTLVDKAASGLESTFWRTMSSQENKPGLLGELDQAQNNELAKIVKATLIKMKLAGEPPNTKMTDIEKVASILNESKLSEEKRIEADKRIVAEIDRRRQEELSTTNNPDAVNAKYDSILKAWNDSMSRQLNMPVSDSMLQRLVSAEMKEQNIKIRDLVDEADGKVVAEKKQNIINSIIRKIYGVSKESETGIEMDENYDGLKSYLEQTLDNMYALSVEEKNAAYAKRQAQISLRNTAESQAQSIINRLADQLSDTPAFPQKQENEVKAIVQQDLKQIPDMNRKQPWVSQLAAKLMRAGVSEAQAQTISDLVWRQHEIKAMDRESKELQTAAEKGSLAVIIDRIKNTSLEKQQSPEWKQEVIKEYLRDAGLSSQAAETAAKLYDSVISERIAAAKQKAFEDTLAKAAPWKNYASRNGKLAKDALKKIKEAIRTGVLDPEKNTESIIAALSGWTGFTKEQYQRIVELDTILNDPNQDDITKREAMDALNKIITKAKMPVRFKDALGAYYIGNALMGIPTALVNIASPLGFSIRNLMVDIAKYAKENPAKIPVAFETFLDSMRSWYNQTAYAFKNQIYLNDVVEYLNGQNVLRETFDKGKKQWAEGKYAQGFANMAVGMTQITGRVLSALDQGAISMLENQNITRYAMSALENAKNKVPKNKVVEFANMTLDLKRRVMMESIAAGMDKDRAGVLADLAVKSELRAALSEYGAYTQSVLDSAINDALQSVGRNKVISINGIKSEQQKLSDSGMLSYWPIKMLEKASEGVGSEGSGMQIFAKMVYGFALVPARTFHTAAWFSPYGFLRLAIDKYKKNKGYESPYAMSVQTDAQFRQRLTESIAGSIAMLGLFALRSGSSDEDEDKKFKIVITGNGPNATTDKQYYDSWIKKYKPYSIHIVVGDTVIPINIGRGGEALFFPIMLAGALDDYEIKKKQNLTKKEPSDLNVATEMLGSAFFALAQRGPYAAFTEPLFDASKQGRVTENLVSQLGYFGKTFVPVLGASITRNISDFINDPVDRSSIEGALYANTPVVGPWIGTKALNALGQPIRADDFSDKLFKLGVPVVFSFPKNTPENALNELILKQGSGPTLPTRANAQKRFGDVLTDKEFETYVREYGRVMSDKMFKNRTRLANMKAVDYDDELEKYARGYSIDGIKIKGASDSAVLAVKRMRQ